MSPHGQAQRGAGLLAGLRVMIVEDEYSLASLLAELVQDMGGEAIGPFAKTKPALAAITQRPAPDMALLDVILGTEYAWRVADELLRRDVEVMLMTGYDDEALPAQYAHLPLLGKPFTLKSLQQNLAALSHRCAAAAQSASATPPDRPSPPEASSEQ